MGDEHMVHVNLYFKANEKSFNLAGVVHNLCNESKQVALTI